MCLNMRCLNEPGLFQFFELFMNLKDIFIHWSLVIIAKIHQMHNMPQYNKHGTQTQKVNVQYHIACWNTKRLQSAIKMKYIIA